MISTVRERAYQTSHRTRREGGTKILNSTSEHHVIPICFFSAFNKRAGRIKIKSIWCESFDSLFLFIKYSRRASIFSFFCTLAAFLCRQYPSISECMSRELLLSLLLLLFFVGIPQQFISNFPTIANWKILLNFEIANKRHALNVEMVCQNLQDGKGGKIENNRLKLNHQR